MDISHPNRNTICTYKHSKQTKTNPLSASSLLLKKEKKNISRRINIPLRKSFNQIRKKFQF